MKGVLVRVGIDSTSGKWNSPVNPHTGKFVYVPIPEEDKKRPVIPEHTKSYSEFEFEVLCQKMGDKTFPSGLREKYIHLDPDFSHLSYGDNDSRGKRLKELESGDIVAFYAGMKPVVPHEQRTYYALIGLYEVEGVIPANEIPNRCSYVNAHCRISNNTNDVVVFGKQGTSGRLEKCIPIAKWDKGYRVPRKLLDLWGGFEGRDNGWIQRSAVLPWFTDAARFYNWFKNKNHELVNRNN